MLGTYLVHMVTECLAGKGAHNSHDRAHDLFDLAWASFTGCSVTLLPMCTKKSATITNMTEMFVVSSAFA